MKKAVFLDRDGTINNNCDHYYIWKKEELLLNPGVCEALAILQERGYMLIVISNQGGISKGEFGMEDVEALHAHLRALLEKEGVHLDEIYYCPHHPTKGKGDYRKACDCRKPKAGLILQASKQLGIELKQSIFIGDKLIDMQAAEDAGIHNRILYSTLQEDFRQIEAQHIDNLASASRFIEQAG